MAGKSIKLRDLIALVLLAVLAVLFVSLGNWQLDRARERDALRAAIEQGRAQAPLELTSQTSVDALTAWRPAIATGQWRHDLTILVDNRNYQGQPGFWVATPLMLTAAPDTALLVLRGWLPRPMQTGAALPDIPRPSDVQRIEGEILERVPRLLELGKWAGAAQSELPASLPDREYPLPRVQNVDLADLAQATGLKFMPVVLAQTEGPSDAMATKQSGDALIRDWPEPPLDASTNRGYAAQWFGFALIAMIAILALIWHRLRRRSPSSSS